MTNQQISSVLVVRALKPNAGTSQVVQWLGIVLAMQGTRVPCLVGELSPMCLGAAKPVHNYGARVPELEGPRTALGIPMRQ